MIVKANIQVRAMKIEDLGSVEHGSSTNRAPSTFTLKNI
jgi:hypothetical protein